MIFGKKEELNLYKGLSENMAKGIDFLMNFDASQPEGKYEVDGNNVYAIITSGKTSYLHDVEYAAMQAMKEDVKKAISIFSNK